MKDVADMINNLCNVRGLDPLCKQFSRTCRDCHMKKIDDIHPYAQVLFKLRNMKEVGCQIAPNTLSEQQWQDLIIVENGIAAARKKKKQWPETR